MKLKLVIFLFLLAFMAALYAYMEFRETQARPKLVVFAASSLAYVFKEEQKTIEGATGLNLVIVEAASSTLARQIAKGAPADIFITADETWLKDLQNRSSLLGPGIEIARNGLVLVFPFKDFSKFCRVQFFAAPSAPDLLAACPYSGKVATGDSAFVPLGKYAAEALDRNNLSLDLIPAADARSALGLFVTGAAGAAILYATDARGFGEGYTSFPFPESSHQPILYFAAALNRSTPAETDKFLAFLKSEAFKTILKARGFEAEGS
jgi:molybdate transport system substrate-binding protein